MRDVQVIPIQLGTVQVERPVLELSRGYGEVLWAPMWGWLIKDGSDTTLVDCGPPPADWCASHTRNVRQDTRETIHARLRPYGLRPEQIERVVLTHLHWDHSGVIHEFPAAEVFVQRSEVDYALDPLWVHEPAFWMEDTGAAQALADGRMTVIDGRAKLSSSVEVELAPGHTPGSQIVLVGDDSSRVLIAGDTISLLGSIEDSGASNRIRPGGVYVDLQIYIETLDRLQAMKATILPGHEPSIDSGRPIRP